jgi:hypothetical protein
MILLSEYWPQLLGVGLQFSSVPPPPVPLAVLKLPVTVLKRAPVALLRANVVPAGFRVQVTVMFDPKGTLDWNVNVLLSAPQLPVKEAVAGWKS